MRCTRLEASSNWALAFPAGLGLKGIWITMIVDWAARTAVLGAVYRRGRWKGIQL